MKTSVMILCAILIFISTITEAAEWTGNINGFLGQKTLNEDDWEPVEEHGEIGIKVDFREKSWPVNIAIDLLTSKSNEETTLFYNPSVGYFTAKTELKTTELNIGLRKIWDHFPTVRPFLEGGISFISVEGDVSAFGDTYEEDDSGTGLWIGGGVYWALSEHFNLGLELMASSAEVTILNDNKNAGGGHFGVLAGYHW